MWIVRVVYMALVIEIGVAVNRRTVTMLVVIMMPGMRSMDMKGETLRLQRKERKSCKTRQATAHKPESMEA